MSRYRRQLTRPEIARLADETTELRRELQDLVSRGKPKTARVMASDVRVRPAAAEPSPTAGAPSRRGRKRR